MLPKTGPAARLAIPSPQLNEFKFAVQSMAVAAAPDASDTDSKTGAASAPTKLAARPKATKPVIALVVEKTIDASVPPQLRAAPPVTLFVSLDGVTI